MSNPQIEELRKKYKDNIINYDEIGMLFNIIDTLNRLRILKENMEEITIPIEEYKELLVIKGKYEEIRRIQQPLIIYDGYKEDGTTIMPYKDRTNSPVVVPPYKVTC